MRGITGFILLFAVHFSCFAQSPQAVISQRNRGGTLSGKVVDQHNDKPIEYAYIVVYNQADSAIVEKDITNKAGEFSISGLRSGHFFAEVQFVGFNTYTIDPFTIDDNNRQVNAGRVALELSAEMLEELQVEAQVNRVSYQLDRRVVNVSQDLAAVGGSIVDVLRNVPSVQTDIDDNVSIRGTESFLVLIDGRPSPVSGSEALQQIPAESVESIEIITNPSAKYDAEGVGGIINVVMKKNRRLGYNAQVSASYGSFHSFGGDVLVNIKKEKLNFFLGGSYHERITRGKGKDVRESYLPGDTVFHLHTENERRRLMNSGDARVGFDYYIRDDEIVTASVQYTNNTFGHDFNSRAQRYYALNNRDFNFYRYITNNELRATWGYFSGDINYSKKFIDPNHEIQMYASYANSFSDRSYIFSEQETDAAYLPFSLAADSTRTLEDRRGKRTLAKVDYQVPVFSSHKIELGYQIQLSQDDNDYRFQQYADDVSLWKTDANGYNPYTFYRNVQSGYMLFSNAEKRFSYMLGLRTEYTDRNFVHTQTQQEWAYHKFDFFPSLHLSYNLPKEWEVMTSYSRRLQRPRPWRLNPFDYVVDPNNVRRGNPLLEPAYTHAVELNVQKSFQKNFIALETYHRETQNQIERQIQIDSLRPDVYIATQDNIGTSTTTGVEMMANLFIRAWWNLNLTGSMSYDEIQDVNNTVTWFARMSNTFTIPQTKTKLELSGFYSAPTITSQGRIESVYMLNAALRQDFFERKLSLNLGVTDLLNTMGRDFIRETSKFYSYSSRKRLGPTFRFSVSYRINDFKSRHEKGMNSQSGGVDDLL